MVSAFSFSEEAILCTFVPSATGSWTSCGSSTASWKRSPAAWRWSTLCLPSSGSWCERRSSCGGQEVTSTAIKKKNSSVLGSGILLQSERPIPSREVEQSEMKISEGVPCFSLITCGEDEWRFQIKSNAHLFLVYGFEFSAFCIVFKNSRTFIQLCFGGRWRVWAWSQIGHFTSAS